MKMSNNNTTTARVNNAKQTTKQTTGAASKDSNMTSLNNNQLKKVNKFSLHKDEINPQFRIAFINTGYRKPYIEASECVQSAFSPHCNETFNIWSHVIALFLFIWKFYDVFSTKHSLLDPENWPLLVAGIGICGFCIASSAAHMFNSMSLAAHNSCFFMDYAAISVYSVGLGQAFYFCSRPLNPELGVFKSEWPFIAVSLLTSVSTTFLCCKTRIHWQRYKYIVRTALCVVPFFVNTAPFLYRANIACTNDVDCISPASLWAFQMHFFISVLAAIVNSLRFPENVFPGVFDVFGQSHNLLHVFVATGASYLFDTLRFDMIARRHKLMLNPVQSSVFNTLLPFVAGIVINVGIALVFSRSKVEEVREKHE